MARSCRRCCASRSSYVDTLSGLPLLWISESSPLLPMLLCSEALRDRRARARRCARSCSTASIVRATDAGSDALCGRLVTSLKLPQGGVSGCLYLAARRALLPAKEGLAREASERLRGRPPPAREGLAIEAAGEEPEMLAPRFAAWWRGDGGAELAGLG